VRSILQYGAKVEAPDKATPRSRALSLLRVANSAPQTGRTPLHHAVKGASYVSGLRELCAATQRCCAQDICRLLMQAKANPNAADQVPARAPAGWVMWAAQAGVTPMRLAADILRGYPATDKAAIQRMQDIVQVLQNSAKDPRKDAARRLGRGPSERKVEQKEMKVDIVVAATPAQRSAVEATPAPAAAAPAATPAAPPK
jgi:hypothetical protein